jgi:hypothetical protein
MNGITTFLVYVEDNTLLLRVLHTLEELEKVKELKWHKWSKIEIWKNNQCKNIVHNIYSFDEMMNFAKFYYFM